MRVAIVGSRTITDYQRLLDAVTACGWCITVVLSGGARGVDTLAARYAQEHNLPCTVLPADWAHYGPRAGPIRNRALVAQADAVLALWDGQSRGTQHTIDCAITQQKPLYVACIFSTKEAPHAEIP